ncbi:MAG: nuclear transport factor 2 family protein [Actinomycetota bacterium]|nr:nuclear transport factor 2 family protein [Actinomycetota bacterium]
MSDENVETLTRIYDGWERGDFTVSATAFEQNAILVIDPEIPDAGVYAGQDGIRTYMTRFLEAWESLTIAAESVEEVGDSVLVEVKQTGIGLGSGVPVSFSYFHLWTFRGGMVIRLDSIMRETRALEAIGLSGRGPEPE